MITNHWLLTTPYYSCKYWYIQGFWQALACWSLHKLKSNGISGQIFGLISSFLSNRWLRVVLDGKSSQEYWVNVGVPQGSILGPTLFLLSLMIFLILSVILLSMPMILLSVLSVIGYLICSNNLNWLLKLNLIYKTLGLEVACWFQCWEHSAGFVWPV